MLERAAAAAARAPSPLTLLAVTVLTSLDQSDLAALGVVGSPREHVLRLAHLATGAGVFGFVTSPHEVAALREAARPARLPRDPRHPPRGRRHRRPEARRHARRRARRRRRPPRHRPPHPRRRRSPRRRRAVAREIAAALVDAPRSMSRSIYGMQPVREAIRARGKDLTVVLVQQGHSPKLDGVARFAADQGVRVERVSAPSSTAAPRTASTRASSRSRPTSSSPTWTAWR